MRNKIMAFAAKHRTSVAVGLMAAVVSGPSMAIDTAADAAFTTLTTEIGTYATPAYGLLVAVLVFFIGMKWFKRVASSAS